MGCVTGLIAKVFLMAFNVAVALVGLIVLTLSAVVMTYLNQYGELVPPGPNQVLIGLQTTSAMVMCLGVFGLLTACCCTNKLFVYIHFILGTCLVVAVLTFGGIGTSNINNEKYQTDIRSLMENDTKNFNVNDQAGNYETTMNNIYFTNECCGVLGYTDWLSKPSSTGSKLPMGCCKDYVPSTAKECSGKTSNLNNIFPVGCYTTLVDEIGEVAAASVKMAIFFGVLLFGLLTSTCLCVRCTNAMPI